MTTPPPAGAPGIARAEPRGPGMPGMSAERGGTRTVLGRVLWLAGFAAAAVVLAACYVWQSRSVALGSDGASNALEAWDMLHGNLLLHGWQLSDVSFYTTELPEYMILETVRGLGPDVVHVAGAVTYTLLLVLAGIVAKGCATGREGLARVLIASGIMLAPQLGSTSTLLLSPDHVGTEVPLLLIWLVIDRSRRRWYVPAVAAVGLAWVQVADTFALYVGVVPLVLVALLRAVRGIPGHAEGTPALRRLAAVRYELVLAAAGLASVGIAAAAVQIIRASGGYLATAPETKLAGWDPLPSHFAIAGKCILELFGANVMAASPGAGIFFAAVHMAGVAAAACGLGLAIWRLVRGGDLVTGVLAVGILVNLAAFIASTQAVDILSSREIAAVLPYGAVLAGRALAGPLVRAGHRAVRIGLASVAAACLACYAVALGYGASQAAAPAQNADLAAFLAAHGLRSGLAGYWQANSGTLDSGGRVTIRSVLSVKGRAVPDPWETKAEWFDPKANSANFVVTVSRPPSQVWRIVPFEATDTFGAPEKTYHFGRYTVLVWNMNLLARMGTPATVSNGQ
jgi:hypothetical protein